MEKHNNDLSSVQSIALQLRVPELKYRIDSSSEQDGQIDRFFTASRLNPQSLLKGSVTRKILKDFEKTPLPRQFNNLAFMTDRFFDSWLRKNNLSSDINDVISKWRFPFFETLYRQQSDSDIQAFVLLLETLAADSFGWCPFPVRSRTILMNSLNEIEVSLFSSEKIDGSLLASLLEQWQQYYLKQQEKYTKVTDRLIDVERRGAIIRYAQALAQEYLNQTFSKHLIPGSVSRFLEDYWLEFLARVFQGVDSLASLASPEAQSNREAPGNVVEKALALTRTIVTVFCNRGEGAFKYGDALIDDLAQLFESHNGPKVPDTIWTDLEQDIVRVLQSKPVDEKLYRELGRYECLSDLDVSANHDLDSRLWYAVYVDGCEHRVQIARVFDSSKQLLLCNHAGIKFEVLSFSEFDQGCQQGDFKALSVMASLSQVIETSLTGLRKVAQTQHETRVKAAEKARKEAEQLLAEKQKSEESAQVKATEIAERTRNIQLKRAEKQRLQREKEVYQALSEFKLGGWIGIAEDAEGDKKIQRYKLAVKLAAAGKYIFVDKLGIRKKQYTTASLVEGILGGEVEILSQGSEFEEDLERVLGRMKMSK